MLRALIKTVFNISDKTAKKYRMFESDCSDLFIFFVTTGSALLKIILTLILTERYERCFMLEQ